MIDPKPDDASADIRITTTNFDAHYGQVGLPTPAEYVKHLQERCR